MSYIEREFYNKAVGTNQEYGYIDVLYGNDFIKTIDLNDTKFEGSQYQKTYVDYDIEIENYQITLTVDIDYAAILIVVESDSFDSHINGELDLEQFDFLPNISLDTNQEKNGEILNIPFYMPTISYTNLASSIVYDVEQTNVVPLFDIESLERFNAYYNDEIITFKHFLDLESSKKVINEDYRTEIKSVRSKQKQLGMKKTPIPEKEYQELGDSEIIDIYNTIEDKNKVIPILHWKRVESIEDDIKALLQEFNFIGIRVSSSYSVFNDKISDLQDKFKAELDKIYIIFDMSNNFAVEQFNTVIDSTCRVFKKTIYLGAQFSASDISKKRKNPQETDINHIYSNKPLEIFEELLNQTSLFGYGDYCGFDRKSITSRQTGGRPTARVVLASIDSSKKLLVRRAWDDKDLKTDANGYASQGLINSMNKLMLDLQSGVLDSEDDIVFLDSVNYDTDEALKSFYPERPAAGLLKTICLRHNYLSIVNNFMSN